MVQDSICQDTPTVVFHRVYPAAIPPLRADKAALGTLPVMAYRHCEPLRMASAFGWYIFPPEDIRLRWNGSDVFHQVDGEWQTLTQAPLPDFADYWDTHAPAEMQGLAPPFLTHLPMRGYVQVWTGLLCSAHAGWSVLVRPLANMRSSHLYGAFEGLVEADRFGPFPLFINLQLMATDVVIEIPKAMPLFQLQPLMRATYGEAAHQSADHEGLAPMSPEDWAGFRRTIRVDRADAPPESGRYTTATRKRTRHETVA